MARAASAVGETMGTREWVDVGLQLLQTVLTWPVAVMIGLWLLATRLREPLQRFATNLAELIARMRKGKAAWFEGEFDPAAGLQVAAIEATNVASVNGTLEGVQVKSEGTTQTIGPRGFDSAVFGATVAAEKPPETLLEKVARLEKTIAADPDLQKVFTELQRRLNHEYTLNLIYGSQHELLMSLNARGEAGEQVTAESQHFANHRTRGASGEFLSWLQFLLLRQLIEAVPGVDGQYRLAAAGRDFLAHVAQVYPLYRPPRAF
jgi:hypothetical protein